MNKTMENKERAIELCAQKVERCKTQELFKEAAKHFHEDMLERKEDR